MKKTLSTKIIVLIQIFLMLSINYAICIPNVHSENSMLPTPSQRYSYSYDQSTTTITEFIDNNPTERKFTSPEKLSAELWLQGQPGVVTGDTPSEEGMIAFQLQGNPDYYLIVRFKTKETMGLYKKVSDKKVGDSTKYFYSWIYASVNDGHKCIHIMKPGGTGQFNIDNSVPEDFVDYVASINGIFTSSTKEKGRGTGIVVANFLGDSIPNGTKICGKTTIDFSASVMWDKLSENDKKLAPKTSKQWPKDFLVAGASRTLDVPLYIQYKFGSTYVNASSGKISNGYVNIKNDESGSWEINMSGLPAGTYKLNPEFFLRWTDNDKLLVRPDTPTQGWYKDWAASASGRKDDDDIEIFTTDSYEITIDKDGNISDPNAKNCSLTLAMVWQGFWNAGRLNAGNLDNACDIGGTGIKTSLIEAFCALAATLKDWADSFFLRAVDWLKASLGITENQPVNFESSTASAPAGTVNLTFAGKISFSDDNWSKASALDRKDKIIRVKSTDGTVTEATSVVEMTTISNEKTVKFDFRIYSKPNSNYTVYIADQSKKVLFVSNPIGYSDISTPGKAIVLTYKDPGNVTLPEIKSATSTQE